MLEKGMKHFYKSVETSSKQTRFRIVKLTRICNELKWIISGSGRLWLLQMVLEPNIVRWCVNEDVRLQRVGL